MTYDEPVKMSDLPEPSHALRLKAWRKAVISAASNQRGIATAISDHIMDALDDMPDGPERDEILRDWRAGYEAHSILAATITRELMDSAPPEGG